MQAIQNLGNISLKKNIYRHLCFSDFECSTPKDKFLWLNLSNTLLYLPKYVFSLNEQTCGHFVLLKSKLKTYQSPFHILLTLLT